MATERRAENSRHFVQIWNKVIQPVLADVRAECDPAFAERCGLVTAPQDAWMQDLYEEYLILRDQLKDVCYGPSDHRAPEELLDGRKIASVLCGALVRKKGFHFDSTAAQALTAERERDLKARLGQADGSVQLNIWAAQNIYINYKLAYYASLQMVRLTLMHDLLAGAAETADPKERQRIEDFVSRLNQKGRLYSYPQPPKGDGFGVNIIIGLARMDMSGKELDTFLFAMQLYQIEEYSLNRLKEEVP